MFMIAAVKTHSLRGETESLVSYPEKIENKRLAAVVTGGRTRSKMNNLGSRRRVYYRNTSKNTGEVLHFMKRWELGSKPRGRQEIQNWLSTPANSAVGTVITTASCQIKPTQIHAAMQQKIY